MRTVLLVDDDPVVLVLLSALLAAEGWQVREAASLADAERALRADRPRWSCSTSSCPTAAARARRPPRRARAAGARRAAQRRAASALPPGVHAVVPKGETDALLDHLAAQAPRARRPCRSTTGASTARGVKPVRVMTPQSLRPCRPRTMPLSRHTTVSCR